ncbi:hypothetical protein D4764_03G0005580 [Takifugu flavidus]|uniref:Uncharacterized protein n=1 Tax=Takifugu flavidus TaxID=433684 RepID=A0A5C6NCC4_9TELE|nr:hypothetical protein D4764_03G0005580 [Takifugu flavidus]
MRFYQVLVVVVALSEGAGAQPGNMGGPERWPWYAKINDSRFPIIGTLISDQWVLTDALFLSQLDNLDEVVRDRMVLKLRTIMDSPSHPLHNTVDKLRSSFSNRLLQPRCSKERDRKSLLPSAIRLYNSSKPSQ